MEFEQLVAFLAVTRTKNFTRAAESLNVVQSTVTTRIKMLEQSMGKELFKRKTRSVELTPAGQSLLPYVEQMMELMRSGREAVRLQPNFESRLVIGGLNSIWDSSIFTDLHEFRKMHDKIAVRMITDHSDHIFQGVQNGTIDVGLVYIPPRSSAIEVLPLVEASLQLVGNPSLAEQLEVIQARDLLQLPFIHYNWGPPFTEWFEAEVGHHDSAAFRVDHTGAFVRLLIQGEGIGFLMDSIAEEYIKEGKLNKIPIRSNAPIPKRMIYMIFAKKNGNRPVVKAVIEYLLKNSHLEL